MIEIVRKFQGLLKSAVGSESSESFKEIKQTVTPVLEIDKSKSFQFEIYNLINAPASGVTVLDYDLEQINQAVMDDFEAYKMNSVSFGNGSSGNRDIDIFVDQKILLTPIVFYGEKKSGPIGDRGFPFVSAFDYTIGPSTSISIAILNNDALDALVGIRFFFIPIRDYKFRVL